MSLGDIVRSEWGPALADAGIEPQDARLYVFEGHSPEDGEKAILLHPGTEAFSDRRFPVSPTQLRDANENQTLCRIGTYEDREPVLLAARLRHELEHARQYQAYGMPILRLANLLVAAAGQRFGDFPGSGLYYNLVPTEQDANAAAACHASSRYREDAERLLNDRDAEAGLLRSKMAPEAIETLPKRMVAFALMFSDTLESYAREKGQQSAKLLDDAFPGTGTLYDLWVTSTLKV